MDFLQLIQNLKVTLNEGRRIEREIQDTDGNWYLEIVSPYLSAQKIKGAVISYVDLNQTKKSENKLKEQENLAKNGILQFFLHRKIEVKDDYFLINGDRLYSVNNVRSAMPIVLKVTVESKDRTETNPYGLILVKTEVLKEDDGKKEKGGVRANR